MYKKLFLLAISSISFSAVSNPWNNWSRIAKGLGGAACFVPAIVAAKGLYNDIVLPHGKLFDGTNTVKDPLNLTQVFAPTIIASSLALATSLIGSAKTSSINMAQAALQLSKVVGGSFLANMGRLVFQECYNTGNKEILPKILAGGASALLGLGGGYLAINGLTHLVK